LRFRAEKGLSDLPDDTGSAELREGVVRRAGGDDRTVRERPAGPVMIGHDDVEAELLCTRDLPGGRDSTVDRNYETSDVVDQARERVAGDAVSLLESAREVPGNLRPKLAKHEDRERGCADP